MCWDTRWGGRVWKCGRVSCDKKQRVSFVYLNKNEIIIVIVKIESMYSTRAHILSVPMDSVLINKHEHDRIFYGWQYEQIEDDDHKTEHFHMLKWLLMISPQMSTSAEHWWLEHSLCEETTDSVIVWSHRLVLWDGFLCSVKNCFAARRQKSTWRGMSNGILWFFEILFKFSLNFLGAGSVILPQTNISNDWTLQRTLLALVVIVICDVFFRFTWQSRLVEFIVWFTRFQLKKDRLGWVAGLKPVELQFMRLLLRHCEKRVRARCERNRDVVFAQTRNSRKTWKDLHFYSDTGWWGRRLSRVECSHFTSFRWHRKAIRKESDDVVKNGFLWKFSLHFRSMVHVKGLKGSFFTRILYLSFSDWKIKSHFDWHFFLSLSGVNLSNFFLLCDYFFYPFSITNKKKTQTEKGEVCEIIYFFLSA